MDDEGPRSPDELVVLRPATWGEAPRWAELRRDVLSAALTIAIPAVLSFSTDPSVRTIALALFALALWTVASLAWTWIARSRERLAVGNDIIELRRWPFRRSPVHLARDERLWASRYVTTSWAGRETHAAALVLSDERDGVRLDTPGWASRHDAVLGALGLEAPRVTRAVAVRRHPEAFSWADRNPRRYGVALGVGFFVLLIVIGIVT